MIRLGTAQDLNTIMELWLRVTVASHAFLPEEFWRQRVPAVRRSYVSKGVNYLWEEEGRLVAFMTLLREDFIGGLFVDGQYQGRGIGTALVQMAKEKTDVLELDVYALNQPAIGFYDKQGFRIICFHRGVLSREEIVRMGWSRSQATI